MRGKHKTHIVFRIFWLFILLAGLFAGNSRAGEDSKYLKAVRTLADNVLKYGRDNYGPKSFFSVIRPLRGGKIS